MDEKSSVTLKSPEKIYTFMEATTYENVNLVSEVVFADLTGTRKLQLLTKAYIIWEFILQVSAGYR